MSFIKAIIWTELHWWMHSTLDFSLMKAAGAFSLLPSYRTVKPACLLPHCACQQKGHRSLMPVSWKWVTAPCHVAELYPDGALCLGTKEHGFPRSLTFSAAIMTAVLQLREKSKRAHTVRCGELNCRPCLVDTRSVRCEVWSICMMQNIAAPMEILNFKLTDDLKLL